MATPIPSPTPPPSTLSGAIVVAGFAATLALWSSWFITHLPWLRLEERVALPLTLGCWALALLWSGWRVGNRFGRRGALLLGAGAGLIAACAGLLILGSKLTETTDPLAMGGANVRPNAGVMALGFLVLGGVMGAIFGLVGSMLAGARSRALGLPQFALVAVCTVAPLVFIGGLVTSTNSGMAVPDWPNTFGSNMFLYPLGPRVPADIFFEHSHRLFGTLVGLSSLVLMIWVLRSARHRSLRPWVIGLFLFICAQGVLGGLRVLQGSADASEDNRWWSMLHGIKGQLAFALTVAVAVFLVPAYRATKDRDAAGEATPMPEACKLRFLATGALHSTILQLVLGAMYRHLRHDHVMWTHAAFALIVATLALLAGFVAANASRTPAGASSPEHPLAPTLRTIGIALVVVVGVQFVMGWATFLFGGRGIQAAGPVQALLRTIHQANGAAMLGLLTALFLFARVLAPKTREATVRALRAA